MKYIEFVNLIDEFISSLKESDIYLKYQELDLQISKDSKIISLAKKRDKLYDTYSSDRSKKEILIDAKKIHDEINSFDIVKEYYSYQKQIRDILSILNENIYKKVYL